MVAADRTRATLRDVAEAAGVSTTTASYVIGGRSDRPNGPAPETKRKVLRAARDLGYRTNQSARTLRRARTELVALAHPTPTGPFIDSLTQQAEDYAFKLGYGLVQLPVTEGRSAERAFRLVLDGHVDGLILATRPPDDLDLTAVQRATRSIVIIHDDDDAYPGRIDLVRSGEQAAFQKATELLLRRGRERIGYLSLTENPQGARFQGFRDGLAVSGLEVDTSLLRWSTGDRRDTLIAVEELLSLPEPPTAILSESDRGAVIALQVAYDHGIGVPQELAVIGAGNTDLAELSSPPLTSVGMPELDFAPVLEALFTRIEQPDTPARTIRMNWDLYERATT